MGRDLEENLIAESLARPLTADCPCRLPQTLARLCHDAKRLSLTTIISDHPLDKIFRDISAHLQAFPYTSVRDYGGKMFRFDF
jgi:hypothetical protein